MFAKLHATPGSPVLAPCYDGNGNILAYLDCATGQALARYEYDPFGKLLLKEEDTRVAGRLHHQFSTKYTDEETGLSYYGYRYYAPELGRWVSRDPIGELGGINLYGFVSNHPVGSTDRLGTDEVMDCRIRCVVKGVICGLLFEAAGTFAEMGCIVTFGPDPPGILCAAAVEILTNALHVANAIATIDCFIRCPASNPEFPWD